jgi:hypothetical protein
MNVLTVNQCITIPATIESGSATVVTSVTLYVMMLNPSFDQQLPL